MKSILVVEDDEMIIRSLSEYLTKEGYVVNCVDGQEKAISWLKREECDLVLLDVSLAQGNGFTTCNAIKQLAAERQLAFEKSEIPIIFLTASGDEYSVVMGLDMGADDYINKPFRPRELLSRMKSVLRRYNKDSQVEQLVCEELRIDVNKAVVYKKQEELFLSALEYRILLLFMNHKGQILTRDQLLSEIWDLAGEYVNDNTLTVYIKRLREKIEEDPSNPKYIKTVRGMGYRMD